MSLGKQSTYALRPRQHIFQDIYQCVCVFLVQTTTNDFFKQFMSKLGEAILQTYNDIFSHRSEFLPLQVKRDKKLYD